MYTSLSEPWNLFYFGAIFTISKEFLKETSHLIPELYDSTIKAGVIEDESTVGKGCE